MLIGFGHAAGVGKDEAARSLVENHGFTRLAFADPVREVAYQSNAEIRRLVDLHGWERVKRVYPAVRLHLIDLGDAMRRHLWAGVLIEAVFHQMHEGMDYVISDVRYPAEVQSVIDHGLAVKINRPGHEPGHNTADQALAGFVGWSDVIDNDGSLEDLAAKVSALVTVSAL